MHCIFVIAHGYVGLTIECCSSRQAKNGAVATINEADFEKLVKRKPTHPGVVVVPSGGSREEQYEYLTTIADFLRTAPNAMEAAKNHIICVNEEMTVTARLACAGFQPVLKRYHQPKKRRHARARRQAFQRPQVGGRTLRTTDHRQID